MDISIRFERPGDSAGIREVNELAFAGPTEARIVDALRGAADAISLVATAREQVVGHILFTPVTVDPSPPGVAVAGLAPMAVRPDFQRRGVGSALVHAGLEECRRRGYGAVVVVGHPDYYPRFGFVRADTKGLVYGDPVPREAFMVVELAPGALDRHIGVVRYRPEFALE